jgi:hypothetical protein
MQWFELRSMRAVVMVAGMAMSWACATLADAAEPEPGVLVANHSTPVRCAEADNVTLTFRSAKVRRFRIEATHPTYLNALREDNWDADWTGCDFGPKGDSAKPANDAKPAQPKRKTERVTLYEEPGQWLVGWRYPEFWRPATATVRVGDRVAKGIHLLQLWRLRPNGGEEVVVLYPQDGYWRARPPAPKGRDLTAFGSSFLIGPVEVDERPIVRLREIVYEPDQRTFRVSFARGGEARVAIAQVDAKGLALDVTFDKAIGDLPFAALRSMFVTEINNDVAQVAVRPPRGKGWLEAGIMTFQGGEVAELWAGRTVPSRHNTSAPDMTFKAFRSDPAE